MKGIKNQYIKTIAYSLVLGLLHLHCKDLEKPVIPLRDKPKACFTSSCQNSCTTAPITLDASCSTNVDTYLWDFGNSTANANANKTAQKPSIVFPSVGRYTVKLIVNQISPSLTLSDTLNQVFVVQ